MDTALSVILFSSGLVSLVAGLSVFVGFGWAAFLFDLLTHTFTTDYPDAQRAFPGSKNKKHRIVAVMLIALGIILLYFPLSGRY